MSGSNLIFMCRVDHNKADQVVDGFETFAIIPVEGMSGLMDVLIGIEELNWLIQQCSFDR